MITCIAYIPAISAGFIWDDDYYVTNNPTLRSWGGLSDIWFDLRTSQRSTPQYYPMVFTTFWIEHHLWGNRAAPYHIVNILLHGLNAGLLWLVLRKLGVHAWGSLLAAAVFALHPVHVESVAWITERKNVLSLFFYLLAALAYLRFAAIGHDRREQAPSSLWKWYGLALGAFAAALGSKTITCTFPAAMLVVIWWKRGRLDLRRDIFPTLPFFALGIAGGLLTATIERENVWGGQVTYDYSVVERFLIAGRVAWFYAGKLLWPANLAFIYPQLQVDASRAGHWLYPITAIGLVLVLWSLRGRIGRGPLAAALFFGGTLVPALGFVPVYPFQFSIVADHFQYHASLGVIVLVCAAIAMSLHRLPAFVRALVPFVLLCGLGALTFNQARIYHNSKTLWEDTLAKNPGAWIAHNNLAYEHLQRGEHEQAARSARAALQLRDNYAGAHINLGLAIEGMGSHLLREAIEEYQKAVAIAPRHAQARLNLANALMRTRDFENAEVHLRAAVASNPNLAAAHHNLAALLLGERRFAEAVESCRDALALQPNDPDTRSMLGFLLLQTGQREAAIAEFREALRLDPDHARSRAMLQEALGSSGGNQHSR